jgi:hypothetical protein
MTDLGKVQTTRWTTVAADVDGVPQPEAAGQVAQEKQIYLAWREEADVQTATWFAEGYDVIVSNAAVGYFGPTDAPGNCWCVTGRKVVSE